MEQADVVVLGGGPAGAASAIWLALAGRHVVVLDRARFPRDKPCGEYLTPAARAILDHLGLGQALEAAGIRPVRRTVLHGAHGRQYEYGARQDAPVGWSLRRTALDALLIAAARDAGADVREETSARALARPAGSGRTVVSGVGPGRVPFEIESPVVIGADGSHSLAARYAGLGRALQRLQRVALASHWHGIAGPTDAIEMFASGPAVFGLGHPGPGEGSVLTLVVPTSEAPRIAGRPADYISDSMQQYAPILAERLSGASLEATPTSIGCFGHVCHPAGAEGILLVGDAASFIDPFTGEGVSFALQGSQIAADVTLSALAGGGLTPALLRTYERRRAELSRRYLLCDVIQRVVHAPAIFDRALSRLQGRPAVAERLMSVLGGLRPPADALNPAFLWRLLAPGM